MKRKFKQGLILALTTALLCNNVLSVGLSADAVYAAQNSEQDTIRSTGSTYSGALSLNYQHDSGAAASDVQNAETALTSGSNDAGSDTGLSGSPLSDTDSSSAISETASDPSEHDGADGGDPGMDESGSSAAKTDDAPTETPVSDLNHGETPPGGGGEPLTDASDTTEATDPEAAGDEAGTSGDNGSDSFINADDAGDDGGTSAGHESDSTDRDRNGETSTETGATDEDPGERPATETPAETIEKEITPPSAATGKKSNTYTFSKRHKSSVSDDQLAEMDFSSCRLIAAVTDTDILTEDTDILYENNGLCLLIFPNEFYTKNAYTYYADLPEVLFVTPDYQLSADTVGAAADATSGTAASESDAEGDAAGESAGAASHDMGAGDGKESLSGDTPEGAGTASASDDSSAEVHTGEGEDQADLVETSAVREDDAGTAARVIVAEGVVSKGTSSEEDDDTDGFDPWKGRTPSDKQGMTADENPFTRLDSQAEGAVTEAMEYFRAVAEEEDEETVSSAAWSREESDEGGFFDLDTEEVNEIAETDTDYAAEEVPNPLMHVLSAAANGIKSLFGFGQVETAEEQPPVIALIDTGVAENFYRETPEAIHHAYDFVAEGEEGDYEEGYLPLSAHYNVTKAAFDGDKAKDSVIARFSVTGEDEYSDENGHGSSMARYILQENPDAQIISIKAMDEDGYGNVSDLCAAILLAVKQDASIINLSLSTFDTGENPAIRYAVGLAREHEALVVASAGNNASDASYFTPANLETVCTIGAADELGNETGDTNFGDAVDYYVWADSTSEAAARFSGIISAGESFPAFTDDIERYLENFTYIFTDAVGDGISYWKNVGTRLHTDAVELADDHWLTGDNHLLIKKVGIKEENGKETRYPLAGAVFRLTRKDEHVDPNDPANVQVVKANSEGIVKFKKLEPGVYEFVEVQAPTGYTGDDVTYEVRVVQAGDRRKVQVTKGSTLKGQQTAEEANHSYKPTESMTGEDQNDFLQLNFRTTIGDRTEELADKTGLLADGSDGAVIRAEKIHANDKDYEFYLNKYAEWTNKSKRQLKITIETNADDIEFEKQELTPGDEPTPPEDPRPSYPSLPSKPVKPMDLEPPEEPKMPDPVKTTVHVPVEGGRVVYAFTTCTAHDFQKDLAVRNFNWLKQFYDIVDIICIDGYSANKNILYFDDVKDIESLIENVVFAPNQHYAVNVVKGLSEYLKTHDPDVIYTSFDRLVSGDAPSVMSAAEIESTFARLKEYSLNKRYYSATGGYRYDSGTSTLGWRMLWGLVNPKTWQGVNGNNIPAAKDIEPNANYKYPYYIVELPGQKENSWVEIEEPDPDKLAQYLRDVGTYESRYKAYLQQLKKLEAEAAAKNLTLAEYHAQLMAEYEQAMAEYDEKYQAAIEAYNAAMAEYNAKWAQYWKDLKRYQIEQRGWVYQKRTRTGTTLFTDTVNKDILITGVSSNDPGVNVSINKQNVVVTANKNYTGEKNPLVISIEGVYNGDYGDWFDTNEDNQDNPVDVKSGIGVPYYNEDTLTAYYIDHTISVGSPKLYLDYDFGESMKQDPNDLTFMVENREIAMYSFRIRKVDKDGKPLAGAVFVLQGTSNDGIPYDLRGVSDENGWASFSPHDTKTGKSGIREGHYTLRETEAPTGYKPVTDPEDPTDVLEVRIDKNNGGVVIGGLSTKGRNEDDGLYEFEAVNYRKPVLLDVHILKIDSSKAEDDSTNKLSGAVFRLYQTADKDGNEYTRELVTTDGDGNPVEPYLKIWDSEGQVVTPTEKTTNEDEGKLVFEGLSDGRYELEEIRAPQGYQAGGPWSLTVSDGKLYWDDKEVQPADDHMLLLKIKNDTKEKYRLRILKVGLVDEHEDTLRGAEFSLRRFSDDTADAVSYDTRERDADGNVRKDKAGNDLDYGELNLTDLEKDEIYVLKETKAPEGFMLDTEEHTIHWKDGIVYVDGVALGEKEGDIPLYRFHNEPGRTISFRKRWIGDGKTNDEREKPLFTVFGGTYTELDANGDPVDEGAIETLVGNTIDGNWDMSGGDTWVYTMTYAGDYDYAILYEDVPVGYQSTHDRLNPLTMVLDGTDTITNTVVSETGGIRVVKKNEAGDKVLPNALFRLTGVSEEVEGAVHEGITDSDGKWDITNLIPGTYELQELIAPENYILSGEIKTVVIGAGDTPDTLEVSIDNEDALPRRIEVQKVWTDEDGNPIDGGDASLPGAVTVKLYADGIEADTAELNLGNSWHHLFDGEDGKGLPATNAYGKRILYSVVEEVPTGWTVSYTSGERAAAETIAGTEYRIVDYTIENKRSTDPGILVINKADGDTGQSLEGAEFTLTGIDGTPTEGLLYQETTGPGGQINFTKLKPGRYVLRETKLPLHPDVKEQPELADNPKYQYMKMSDREIEIKTAETLSLNIPNYTPEEELPRTGGRGLSPVIWISLLSLALMRLVMAVKKRWGVV